jgi:class 3 adenylate cyclase
MSNRPAGTITFLFADVEGSTGLWEHHAFVMRVAMARHEEILRGATEAQGRYVFKAVGDAFCAAFPTALPALEAALGARRALLEERRSQGTPLLTRAASHTGSAEERDGDYFGSTVNRVAKLLSAAHGGQALLSLPTHEMVRDQPLADTALKDSGERRLRISSSPRGSSSSRRPCCLADCLRS